MNMKKVMVLGMISLLALSMVGLSGCSKSSKEYDVYIYNTKSEIADSMQELCGKYEEEAGVKVKVLTVGTEEAMETLRSEINSDNYPTIFSCNQASLEEWVEGGFAADASAIQNSELKTLYESLPNAMILSNAGEGNYGIPYNIEGYGLIANKNMLKDILGLTDVDAFLTDYKAASYGEFENMIVTFDKYIKNSESSSFTLNGTTYTTAAEKTDLTQILNGVFAIAGAEKWTYGNHYANYALNTVFDTYDATKNATAEDVELLRNPLKKSLKELEFVSNYTAGPNGAITRGSEYINSTVTSYDQTVQTFAQGKAIFIKQGNWIYSTVAGIDQNVAVNLCMLPYKVNFEQSDISADGMTVEKMNQSVAEFISQYYIVNAKATEEEKTAAEAFLLWLNTSETGKDYIVNKFAFVPFNADASTNLENPLSNDLIAYKEEGNVLCNAFDAVPNSWGTNAYGKVVMENLFTFPGEWEDQSIDSAVDESINYWLTNMK